jgi:hypothetical protein
MRIVDQVEYDLFKTVAQIVVMRGGDVERIPNNYEKLRAEALRLGFIAEDNEKSLAKSEKKVLTVDRGQA